MLKTKTISPRAGLLVAAAFCLGVLQAQQNSALPGPAPKTNPLGDTPALSYVGGGTPSWLKLSGELQFRSESRGALGFKPGNDDSYGLFRTRLNIGIKPTNWMEFFFQGQDSRAPGIRDGAHNNGVFRNPFDVRQAYVKFSAGDSGAVSFTAGRQLLVYGDQRLVGALDWTNTSRTFDALKLEVSAGGSKFDFFSASVVANDPTRSIDRRVPGNNLHGTYGKITNWIPKTNIEPYLLWRTNPRVVSELGDPGSLSRVTGGVRLYSKPGADLGGLDYNLAWIRQWGDLSSDGISAWASYSILGYTFKAPMSPRVFADYSFASGDEDPADGKIGWFDDIYPTAHLYYGFTDSVGFRNIKNLRLGNQFSPHKKLKATFDYHFFWLANANDALYNVGGGVVVPRVATGATKTKVGDEVNLTLAYAVRKTFTVGAGWGRLFAGPFLKTYSPGADNNFVWLFTSFKF